MSGFDLFNNDEFLEEYELWYSIFSDERERIPNDAEIERFAEHYLEERKSWHKLSHDLDNIEYAKEMRDERQV